MKTDSLYRWNPGIGDRVRLKSGGPVMVVTKREPMTVTCEWWRGDTPDTHEFHPACLDRLDDAQGDYFQ